MCCAGCVFHQTLSGTAVVHFEFVCHRDWQRFCTVALGDNYVPIYVMCGLFLYCIALLRRSCALVLRHCTLHAASYAASCTRIGKGCQFACCRIGGTVVWPHCSVVCTTRSHLALQCTRHLWTLHACCMHINSQSRCQWRALRLGFATWISIDS